MSTLRHRVSIRYQKMSEDGGSKIGSQKDVTMGLTDEEFVRLKGQLLQLGEPMIAAFQMFFDLVEPKTVEEKAAEAGFTLVGVTL